MLALWLGLGIFVPITILYVWAFHADKRDRARRDARWAAEEAPDVLSARDRKSLPPDLADAAPWISYPLAEEDWALFESAGWRTAEHRAAFERAQASVDAQVTWWEEPEIVTLDRWEPVRAGWAWKCTCGGGSGHGFPDEQAAMLSAQAHLTRDHRR